MYYLNKESKVPLHIQLFNALKKDIKNNYKVNEKLPSIRKVASTYNLSKNTVENAFSQLVAEGYIEGLEKVGYIVLENNNIDFSKEFINETSNTKEEEKVKYDFFPASLEKESFPTKTWKRLFNKVLDESIDFGVYTNRQGENELREEIAKYLNKSRAVKCCANQIVLGNGFISSISLLALILKNIKDITIEEPGYHVARRVFENHNFKINRINVNKQGINLDELFKTKSKLVYITPSHQYPLGVAIPIANRLKLLKWAQENDSYIIEDDYDSELSYFNRPIPSLQGLDSNENVVYIGTFSKALSPSLRVSYIVLPKPLLEIYNKNFFYYDSGVSLMIQKTLTLFLKEGFWDRHLRKIRTLNKKKHNQMLLCLEKYLKNSMEIISQGGGLAIIIRAKEALNYERLEKEALKKALKVHLLKHRCGDNFEGIMMGFGGIKEEEIEKAVEAFSKVWFKCFIN